MKTSFISTLCVVALALCLGSCKKSKTRNVNIDLHTDAPLSGENDQLLPKEIVKLLEPIECEGAANAIVTITVHRHDFNPVKTAAIEIPVSGASALRKKLNMLAFEHLKAEYTNNSLAFPNVEILYAIAPADAAGTGISGALPNGQDNFTFTCCDESGGQQGAVPGLAKNFDALVAMIRDSICAAAAPAFSVIYQQQGTATSAPPATYPGSPAPASSAPIEAVFNEIGDKNVDPEKRLTMIAGKMSLFAPNALVKEIGDAGTSSEPSPVAEYLEKIALYRSLDRIEVLEALQNEQGLYWEIRLKEHHANVNR
jgi:hypothetical protein